MGSGCPEGQPCSIQTPDETGACDSAPPEERHAEGHTKEHRKAGWHQVALRAAGDALSGVHGELPYYDGPMAGERKPMKQYLALIHKDSDSDYGVSFPDFPGCVTAGKDLDEARANAVEALSLHIVGMIEDKEAIPEPSSIEEVMADKENADGVVVLIPAPANTVKTVRVNITLPADELELIDSYAEANGFTRSGFLTIAAKKAMETA